METLCVPNGPFLVDDLSRRNRRALVVAGAACRRDTPPRFVQVRPLCTDAAVDRREGEATAEVGGADAAAEAVAGRDVVKVDHAVGAGRGESP